MRVPILLGALAGILVTNAARAHGAVPLAENLFFVDRGGGPEPHLVTTYGVFFRDGAGDWRLACEEAVVPGPKKWTIGGDGRTVMGHADGVASSADFCSYAPGDAGSDTILVVARAPVFASGVDEPIFVLSSVLDPGKNLRRSLDGGTSYARLTLPSAFHPNTVVTDGSKPGRVWATAEDRATATKALLRSDDLGDTWATLDLPPADGASFKVVGAGPSGVFVRVTKVGLGELWRSGDDGETFTKVLHVTGATFAFVQDLGGDEVWAGSSSGTTSRSRDGGLTWSPVAVPGSLQCLKRSSGALWGCAVDVDRNVGLVRSTDDGASWEDVLRYDQVKGMHPCPPASEGAVCEDYWLLSAIGMKVPPPAPAAVPAGPSPESSGCGSIPSGALATWGLVAALCGRARSRRCDLRSVGPR